MFYKSDILPIEQNLFFWFWDLRSTTFRRNRDQIFSTTSSSLLFSKTLMWFLTFTFLELVCTQYRNVSSSSILQFVFFFQTANPITKAFVFDNNDTRTFAHVIGYVFVQKIASQTSYIFSKWIRANNSLFSILVTSCPKILE